jgi:hypothetical protein
MKKYFTALLAFFVLIGGVVSDGYAEEKIRTAPRVGMLDDATMGKLSKLGAPSEQHHILSALIGAWDYDLKYWEKKDSEPQLSTGTIVNEMILGGRFLSGKTNVILNIGGQNIHYEGWSILGYDTIKKAYTSVLVDTMRTGMITGAAQYNEKLKTLEEKGHFTHPLMDKERAYRSELQFTSDDTHKRTVFITDKSGKEFKVLEIEFRRRR